MIKKIKKVKISILENHKLSNSFIIERKYKKSMITEYLVCSNYDFKSNTYENGKIYNDIEKSYHAYTDLVKDKEKFFDTKLEKNIC